MRKYTEEEFTEKLESLLGKESFYSGITNELANYPPFSQAKEVLVATKKKRSGLGHLCTLYLNMAKPKP